MIFWTAIYADTCIPTLSLCIVAGNLYKIKVAIHPGFPNIHFFTQKRCLGRFWKFLLFLDMANQPLPPDSRSNSWPVQKPQAQCQYSYSPPVQYLHGRINTCRKPQHWFAQSYTSCVHTISSRVQINEQESPGRSKTTSKKHLKNVNTGEIIEENALI